jgi:hypothetical protein
MDEMQKYHLRVTQALYWECIPRLINAPGGIGRHWRSIANKLQGGQGSLVNSGWAVMPKSAKQHANGNDEKAQDLFKILAWINCRLDEADKEQISTLQVEWPDIFAWMGERIYAGYRFSFAYDEYSKCCQLSIICRNEDDQNFGCAMSTRHPDPDVAFVSLYYKDVVKLANDWGSVSPTPTGPMWD